MNPGKIIEMIKDQNRSRQERMFILLAMCGQMGLFIGTLVKAIVGVNMKNVLAMLISFVILLGITYFSLRFRKIQRGAELIAALVIFFVLPLNFISGGGIYGGATIWFIFGIIFVCLVVENKTKYILLASGFFVCSICYFIALFFPEWVVTPPKSIAYVDSFSTFVLVTGMICGMILFQNAIYQSENKMTQAQKKEIEELNQMQNRFFSSMSHEIRTPINTIIGLNEMILREDVSDEVASDARSIQGASKMLLTLINDILDMSKIESGNMDIVPVSYDFGAMLSDIVNMIWVRAKEKGLEFHVNVDQTMPSQLYGDEVRIKQVLINVLNNAVKYTAEGSVTLSIQCKNSENGKAQIIYSIEDTGMGIKKESIPFLFTAFRRVDQAKNRYIEGTGLGLSIVKQLVDLMHGEIAVNSVYTKGSTFVITIPQDVVGNDVIGAINLEERHSMNARAHYKQSFEAPNARVLIVDDNEANLMVAEKLLRDTKVMIDTATSGEKCLEKTVSFHYDVIFMDHLMPEMSGIECLHEVRKQTGGLNQNTPVVALTANAGSENQALYRREGFDGYLLKPVSGLQLEAELLRQLPPELVEKTRDTEQTGVAAPVLEHHNKMFVMISTDSVCDLPKNITEKYQVAVMPYRVITEGGEFLDGIETETDGIVSYIEEKGKTVKSEAPPVEEYEKFFAEQLTKAQVVIHISMAKKISLGYDNAREAAKAFDNVFVINSRHLSCGMGILVIRAAEYAAEGMKAEQIIQKIKAQRKLVKTSFIVDKTDFLARVGRISAKIDSICKAIMLHPVIVLKNSLLTVGAIRIGTKKHVWDKYIEAEMKTMKYADKKHLFIVFVGLSMQDLQEIKQKVESKYSFDQVIFQKSSPAISANCGPGTFGLIYSIKEE
ncbi:MAG: DegV family protein [bacterium]|nr:DegV family protein [bacterium]